MRFISWDGETVSSLGVSSSAWPPSVGILFALTHSQNAPCLCPLPLHGSAPEKHLPLCSPKPSIWQLRIMTRFPSSLLTNPRYLWLILHSMCCRPPTTPLLLCWTHFSFSVFFLYWKAENSRNGLTSALKSRITTSLNLLAIFLLMQFSTQAASVSTMMYYGLFQLIVYQDPQIFFCKAAV